MSMTIRELLEYKNDKETAHTQAFNFYDSVTQPGFLSERMRRFFLRNPIYNQNWMATVVNAVVHKLTVEGFQVGADDGETQDPRNETLSAMWDRTNMQPLSDLVHEYCHITGEAFVIVEDTATGPRAYVQDPRSVVVVYDGEDPDQIMQAAKFYVVKKRHYAQVWEVDENGKVITQQFEGRQTTVRNESGVAANLSMSYYPIDEAQPLPYSRIPVFHFRRSLRNIEPEFYQVVDIQKSINHSNTALGYSAEFSANQVMVAITHQDLDGARDQLEPGGLLQVEPAAPGEQPVSITAIRGEDLTGFMDSIDRQIEYIAAITMTPRFYFKDVGAGISGEALQAWEAPLVSKIRRYTKLHAAQWESIVAFMLTLAGQTTTNEDVTCNYANPETVLTISQATARQANKTAGIPIITQLRNEGWREGEINQMLSDKNAESVNDLDEAQLEEVYDRMTEQNARTIEPILAEALNAIATAAVDTIARSGVVERLANVGTTE